MKDPLLRLSAIISRFRENEKESLHDLPDRLIALLEAYNNPKISPLYKTDIFNLVSGTLVLSETLANETYPAPVGVRWCTYLISLLTRLIDHLENRPAVARLGILFPATNELHSETYSTPYEANEALSALRRLGVTQDCLIVPVSLTSGHVVQPPAAPDLSDSSDLSDPKGSETPIPVEEFEIKVDLPNVLKAQT